MYKTNIQLIYDYYVYTYKMCSIIWPTNICNSLISTEIYKIYVECNKSITMTAWL